MSISIAWRSVGRRRVSHAADYWVQMPRNSIDLIIEVEIRLDVVGLAHFPWLERTSAATSPT